jgi:hypothetical protein
MAPMAVASDGTVIVNAIQLGSKTDLAAVVGYARDTGLEVFIGIVVPTRLRGWVLRNLDDALADVGGRLGPKLVLAQARRSR